MAVFILCRLFPGVTDRFPLEKFDDVPDEDYGPALVKLVNELGPPDHIFLPAMQAEYELQTQGQPILPYSRPSTEATPKADKNDPRRPLREWENQNVKRAKPVFGKFADLGEALPFLQKLKTLGWVGYVFDASGEIESNAIAVAPSEEAGRDVATALNRQFRSHRLRPHFLVRNAESIPKSERLRVEQEVDRQKELAGENPLVEFVKSAIDLIGRLALPASPVDRTRPADARGSKAEKRPLRGNALKAAEHVHKNPGANAKQIGLALGIQGATVRRTIAPKLKAHGFRSEPGPDGGYYPPS